MTEILKPSTNREPLLTPAEREQFKNPGWVLVLSGPRGVGKDAVMRKFQKRPGVNAEQIVTYASRQPRTGEVDGEDYNFVTEADFRRKIAEGFFAEHVKSGGYKGTQGGPFREVLMGENRIWRIDPTRAATVGDFYNHVFVPEEA